MRQTYLKFLLVLAPIILLYDCGSNPLKVDVSQVEVDRSFNRFDQLLLSLKPGQVESAWPPLAQKHPMMAEWAATYLFNAQKKSGMDFQGLEKRLFDSLYQATLRDVNDAFPDLSELEQSTLDAFKHIKYYFPQDTLPRLYTIATLSDIKAFTYPNILVLCLDRYLGRDYAYPTGNTPNYVRRTMMPEYAVPDLVLAYCRSRFPEETLTDNSLLSQMIHAGKQLYYLDAMMPGVADSLKIGYSASQMQWAVENQYQLYNHFAEKNLFYETDHLKIDRYLKPAPFTQAHGVPRESPPRLGEWFGWQVVRHYMDNTNTTLEQLMLDKDYKGIFKKARYKP